MDETFFPSSPVVESQALESETEMGNQAEYMHDLDDRNSSIHEEDLAPSRLGRKRRRPARFDDYELYD